MFGAEINVVWFRRLWPRSLVQPPINDGDRRVYRAIVERARMRPEVAVRVRFTGQHSVTVTNDDASPDGAPGRDE